MAIPWRRASRAHRQPAELDRRADDQQPAGGEQLAVGDGDQVDALAVAAVELLALGHALLDAEHLVAQLERRRHLLVAARAADLVGERVLIAARSSRMSRSSAAGARVRAGVVEDHLAAAVEEDRLRVVGRRADASGRSPRGGRCSSGS